VKRQLKSLLFEIDDFNNITLKYSESLFFSKSFLPIKKLLNLDKSIGNL